MSLVSMWHWMNFLFFYHDWQYNCESVVWGISFHNHLGVGNPVSKDRSGSESSFEIIKYLAARGIKIPRNIFLGQLDQGGSHDFYFISFLFLFLWACSMLMLGLQLYSLSITYKTPSAIYMDWGEPTQLRYHNLDYLVRVPIGTKYSCLHNLVSDWVRVQCSM